MTFWNFLKELFLFLLIASGVIYLFMKIAEIVGD